MLRQLLLALGVDPQAHGDDTPTQTSQPSSSSGLMPGSWPAPPITNSPLSGFFAGSTNVNACHGIFTDVTVTRDLNIKVEMQVCRANESKD
jgi:hypothetical protein